MITRDHVEALKQAYGGPMTAAEVELLRNIQSFIEFSIRNGLSFPLVIGTLGHDVNNITRYGFDLDRAKVDGFGPKVSGFSEAVPDAVGDPDEAPEP